MKAAQDIIKNIALTEKGTRLGEKENKYVFHIAPSANKIEVKRAVEHLFKVTVTNVNTLNRVGKLKRDRRNHYGSTGAMKRAIVTLKDGDKIELT